MTIVIVSLVCAGVLFLLVLSIGCFYIVKEVGIMHREGREGRFSVWYQRPMLRQGLKMIGTAWLLALIAGGSWYILTFPSLFVPFNLIAISSGCLMVSILLLVDIRKLHQERQEGWPTVWQKRPKLLRRLRDMAFWLSYAFITAISVYARFHGVPTLFFPADVVIGLGPLLLLLLAAVLHFAANHFEAEEQSQSEERRAVYRQHMQYFCSLLTARANMLLDTEDQHQSDTL